MTSAERVVDWAVRLLPAEGRERYERKVVNNQLILVDQPAGRIYGLG